MDSVSTIHVRPFYSVQGTLFQNGSICGCGITAKRSLAKRFDSRHGVSTKAGWLPRADYLKTDCCRTPAQGADYLKTDWSLAKHRLAHLVKRFHDRLAVSMQADLGKGDWLAD